MNRFISLIAGLSLAGQAVADSAVFESGPGRVNLIELYTSEGCSSCPPAERWMNALTNQPGLWRDFVPVAFHVDYWNGLGWADRFASRENTDRQRRYASSWGIGTIYTPGFVLNGREWRDWSKLPAQAAEQAGLLRSEQFETGRFSIRYRSLNRPGQLVGEIALLGFDQESKIARGENAAKTLRHQFVLLERRTVDLRRENDAEFAGMAEFSAATVAEARAIAAWVEEPSRPGPLQAAGGWLAGKKL
jgi:hypothetical protein